MVNTVSQPIISDHHNHYHHIAHLARDVVPYMTMTIDLSTRRLALPMWPEYYHEVALDIERGAHAAGTNCEFEHTMSRRVSVPHASQTMCPKFQTVQTGVC